jgi:hypothetical protein
MRGSAGRGVWCWSGAQLAPCHQLMLPPLSQGSNTPRKHSTSPILSPVDQLVLLHKALGKAVGVLPTVLAEALCQQRVVPAASKSGTQERCTCELQRHSHVKFRAPALVLSVPWASSQPLHRLPRIGGAHQGHPASPHAHSTRPPSLDKGLLVGAAFNNHGGQFHLLAIRDALQKSKTSTPH